jgi:hypothetical protein
LLEKEKFNRANFIYWYRDLRIVLRQQKTEYVLIELYPEDLHASSRVIDHRAYKKQCDDALNVSCLIPAIMTTIMQKQYEHVDAYTMIQGLHGMLEN